MCDTGRPALGMAREAAHLLADVPAFPVRKFALGRTDTWSRVDRDENFTTVSVEQSYCSLLVMRGRYRLFGFSVSFYGRTEELREALAHSASRIRVGTDGCHPRTRHHTRSSCGCGDGDVVGRTYVADRFHRSLRHHQLKHGAACRLEARIRHAGGTIRLARVEQHRHPIWHALYSHPRELESHYCARWFSHRRFQRGANRFLRVTVELCAQRAISMQLEATEH